MSRSNVTVMLESGSATMLPSAGFVLRTDGATSGASTSTWVPFEISSRPSEVASSCSALGPPRATASVFSVARSTIVRFAPAVLPDGMRAETNSRPASGVPARPNASESAAASSRTCTCARPWVSKLRTSPRFGHDVPHSSPSGAISRSSTRTLLKCANSCVAGSNVSMPSPEET